MRKECLVDLALNQVASKSRHYSMGYISQGKEIKDVVDSRFECQKNVSISQTPTDIVDMWAASEVKTLSH